MTKPTSLALAILAMGVSFALTACPEKKAEPAVVKSPDTAKAKTSQKVQEPALKVVEDTKPGTKSCVPVFHATGEATELQIAGKTYKRVGDVLTLAQPDADDQYTFGQLTDIKEDTPENLGNVKRLIGWMQEQGADALVVTGDLAETEPALVNVMRAVAEFKGPVLIMIGNRESLADFNKAYAAVAPEHANLINMNKLRVFNADDASLVSLPGYYNAAYIHSSDGCLYTPDDVNALAVVSKAATSTLVIASHGPPRQEGITGIDRIHEGANVGDPMLAKYLKEKDVHFGLFGNIQEAGGKATDLTGTEELRQNTFVSDLFLNSGPADSVRWSMLDGTESIGMGGLLRIKADKALYKIHRLRPGEAKPVAPKAAEGAATPEKAKTEEASPKAPAQKAPADKAAAPAAATK